MTTATKTQTNTKSYEFYLVISPESMNDDSGNLEQELEKMFQKHGIEVKNKNKFTRTDLAYPINRVFSAYTGGYYLESSPENIKALENEFKDSDIETLRWMIATVKVTKTTPRRMSASSLDKELEAVERAVAEKDESGTEENAEEEKKEAKKEGAEKEATIEDIDKKLDEIMGNL